jgi:hypothetical protein
MLSDKDQFSIELCAESFILNACEVLLSCELCVLKCRLFSCQSNAKDGTMDATQEVSAVQNRSSSREWLFPR